jgi:hypothetical protein
MHKLLLFVLLLSLSAAASCGGGDEQPQFGSGAGGGTAPAATATVKGKITFQGDAPMPRKISTSGDPKCMNPDLREEAVVVTNGGLDNVMLYVSSPVSGGFPTPTTEALVDQMGCHYIPHAFTVQVNQPIKFRNSDDTSHNIHAWAEVNTPFNISQARKGLEEVKKFTKPEIMLPIRCDVHNWMNSFVGVFAHPYHTVSRDGGVFEMKVPAGKYEITAHHEKFGKKTMTVEVKDNATAELNFTFSAADKAD